MIDKRVKKLSIITIVLVVIISSTTINSSFASSIPATKSSNGYADLKIENVIRANCDQVCPQGGKNGFTTITIPPKPDSGLMPTIIPFPAGPWGVKTIKNFSIPIGSLYSIATKVPEPRYSYIIWHCCPLIPQIVTWSHTDTVIVGACSAQGMNARCESTMGPNGATIQVNYYWGHFGNNGLTIGQGDDSTNGKVATGGNGGSGGDGGHTGASIATAGNGGSGGDAGAGGTSGSGSGSSSNGGNGGNGGNAFAPSGSSNGGNGGNAHAHSGKANG